MNSESLPIPVPPSRISTAAAFAQTLPLPSRDDIEKEIREKFKAKKQILKSQVNEKNKEVEQLQGVRTSLIRDLDNEKKISSKLMEKLEVIRIKEEEESTLASESAQLEISKLQSRLTQLEQEKQVWETQKTREIEEAVQSVQTSHNATLQALQNEKETERRENQLQIKKLENEIFVLTETKTENSFENSNLPNGNGPSFGIFPENSPRSKADWEIERERLLSEFDDFQNSRQILEQRITTQMNTIHELIIEKNGLLKEMEGLKNQSALQLQNPIQDEKYVQDENGKRILMDESIKLFIDKILEEKNELVAKNKTQMNSIQLLSQQISQGNLQASLFLEKEEKYKSELAKLQKIIFQLTKEISAVNKKLQLEVQHSKGANNNNNNTVSTATTLDAHPPSPHINHQAVTTIETSTQIAASLDDGEEEEEDSWWSYIPLVGWLLASPKSADEKPPAVI